MTTHRRRRFAALASAAGLLVVAAFVWRAEPAWSPRQAPETSSGVHLPDETRRLTFPDEEEPVARTNRQPQKPVRPYANRQLRIGSGYLRTYDATRTSWDEVIDRGQRLPGVSRSCARSWRGSGKDRRLDWETASFSCLDTLVGGTFQPQGVAGSATTEHYQINGMAAADRDLILTSWYSGTAEPGLFAPNRAGESATQLVVMDMDQRRYNTIELVRPGGGGTFENLNSHGSGLVWAGQYLYSSSRTQLWMYNADDILDIDGRFVLPAVARWDVSGDGGLSSISLDQSTVPSRLVGINYTKAGQAHLQSFDLAAPDGLLADTGRRSRQSLVLTNRLGNQARVVHSSRSLIIPGSSFQGVGRFGLYSFANSSALRLGGGPVDATVVLKDEQIVERFRMPYGNVQSVYIDYVRGTYVSVTERGSQFLFQLPLDQLTGS